MALMEKGTDLRAKDSRGRTPLHSALSAEEGRGRVG